MTDLEKVIGLLSEIAEYFRECRGNASFGSKAEEHFWELQHAATEASELLKAQEPRVLTIEEVEALEEGTIVWVEENYGGQRYLNPMVCDGDGLFGNYYLGIDINIWLCDGKKRFWISKPTKEQSEATPWEPPEEG